MSTLIRGRARFRASALPIIGSLALVAACSSGTGDGGTDFGPTAGVLTVDPTTPLSVAGPPGGPFVPASRDLTLTNTGGSQLAWSAAAPASWLVLSASAGQLAPAESSMLTIQVDQAVAAGMAPGQYQATVTITNTDSPHNEVDIAVDLDIGDNWSVDPDTTFHTSGSVGGPFSPTDRTYTVQNNFNVILTWSVVSSAGWVTTDLGGGSIDPGDSVQVVASIDQGQAAALGAGIHDATLTFSADQGAPDIVRDTRLTAGVNGLTAIIDTPPNTMKIAPYSTMFSGTDSVEDAHPLVRWDWDFGDDTSADPRTDEGILVGHRFDQPGTYTVTLTVIDASGASDTTSMQVTVDPFAGTTYYVSASGGDDANDGLSTGSPWRTLDHAVASMGGSQNNPNQLLLKRGDVWTQGGSVGLPGPSIVAAYGAGAKPEIRFPGADDHLGLGWDESGDWGKSRIVNDLQLINPTGPWLSKELISGNGFGNTVRRCDLTNGGIIATHTAGVDPSDHAMMLIFEDTNIYGSRKMGFYTQYHTWLSARRCSFTGNGTSDYNMHQMYLNIVEKVLWEDCYFDGADGLANYAIKQNSVVDGLFRRCEITNVRNGIDCGTNFSDFDDPSNTNLINEDLLIHNIGKNNQGVAIRMKRVQSVTVRNCEIHAVKLAPSYAISTIAIDNNDPGAEVWILNNTFYSNEVPDIDIGAGIVFDRVEIKNNIFYRTGTPKTDHSFYEISDVASASNIDSDYNSFYWLGQGTGDLTFAVGDSDLSHSFDTWRTSFSQDANSSWFDPLFADPANGNFSLLNGSPAIDAGTALALSHDDIDGDVRPAGAAHDLGSRER